MSQKTGIPLDVLEKRGLTAKQVERMERINDSDLPRASTQPRSREENAEDRKARKQAIKMERKVRASTSRWQYSCVLYYFFLSICIIAVWFSDICLCVYLSEHKNIVLFYQHYLLSDIISQSGSQNRASFSQHQIKQISSYTHYLQTGLFHQRLGTI